MNIGTKDKSTPDRVKRRAQILPRAAVTTVIALAVISGVGTIGHSRAATNTRSLTSYIAPQLSWSPPPSIIYGTALDSTQLDATADVSGTFAYNPPSGTVLHAGTSQTLAATFTPDDTADYESGDQVTASITVNQASLTLNADAKSVYYGDLVPAFTYTPVGLVNGDTLSVLSGPITCGIDLGDADGYTEFDGRVTAPASDDYEIECGPRTVTAADYIVHRHHGELTVLLAPVSLKYTGRTTDIHAGKKLILKMHVSAPITGDDVGGRLVTMSIGSQSCSRVTDSGGDASCTLRKLKAAKGQRTLKMTMAGDPPGMGDDPGEPGPNYDYQPGLGTKVLSVHK